MRVINLASGSKGNCTLISTEQTKILLDCGLGINELIERLTTAGEKPENISAIVITHEHSDHIKGLKSFSRRFKVCVFAHKSVMPILAKYIDDCKEMPFDSTPFAIGDILVSPFPVSHDSINCQGYTFTKGSAKFGYATDLGFVSGEVLASLIGSKLVFVETNHDIEMLKNGPYPPILKARVKGKTGHLSNADGADLISTLAQNGTKYFALAHLSETNNTPSIAFGTVANTLENKGFVLQKDVFIRLTYQHKIGNNFNLKE